MNTLQEVERLEELLDELRGGLDFYMKFVGTTNPRHRGIPYMAASENFSTNPLYAYGKFLRLYKKIASTTGLTSMIDKAAGYDGWMYQHRRAMGILFPRSPDKTVVVDDVATIVPQTVEKDPERASKALPYLQKMIDLMDRDVNNLASTIRNDPAMMSPPEEVLEAVIRRIRRLNAK